MKLILFLFSISLASVAAPMNQANNFFKDKTQIENPFSLRDPFKPVDTKINKDNQRDGFRITGKGQYSNISDTALDQLQVSNLKLVGVLIGKERRALVSISEGRKVIVLKEGMKIGPDGAELKAILPGGIVLVEKIVNVYGEEEFLETVVPISR